MRRLAVVLALLLPVYALAQSTITVVSDEPVAGITVTKTGVDAYTISLSGTAASVLHASSHASAGTDPVTLAQSQITNLTTDLAAKLSKSGGTMTGSVAFGTNEIGFVTPAGGAPDNTESALNSSTLSFENHTTGNSASMSAAQIYAPILASTVATGTAPMSISSTTKVANLNADMVDGYSIPAPSTSGNVLTSNGTAWTSAAPAVDGDAVTGNEVTNATNSTLTRSGSGTAVDPYTLGINLGTANTWTATQTIAETDAPAIVATGVLDNATGDEAAYTFNYTVNKATSGNDTGLQINMTDTASPGVSYLLSLNVGGTSVFSVSNAGRGLSGLFSPRAHNSYDLGESGLRWKDSWFSGTMTGRAAVFQSVVATDTPMTLKAHSAQTADLQQWQNSSGVALSSMSASGMFKTGSTIEFEGSTANDYETTLSVTDPTADRTITIPDQTGTVGLWVAVPASATATGSPGQYAYDASYLYICTATDTWKRVAIAAW